MPEGDTVWRTANRLHQALAGQPLATWDLRWGELATTDLVGATTVEVVSRGKHILQRLDAGVTLHSHLRMEGQWRIEDAQKLGSRQRANPQIRALVATERWAALGLRLGMLNLLPTGQEHTVVGHLGPDVLGHDWDAGRAVANLHAAGTTILLVEQNANLALQHADRGYVLEAGRISLGGPAADLLRDERVRKAYLG